MIKTLIATTALVTLATAAHAGTYRVDVMPADGVKFAPFGAGEILEDGAETSAAIKLQAIDGKPVDAYAGHNNMWFIIEAEEGDKVVFTAMNGKSVDQIGQAVIEIPAQTEMRTPTTIMSVEGEMVDTQAVSIVPAQRESMASIVAFDAGADEGRDTLMLDGTLGSVKVTRLSK